MSEHCACPPVFIIFIQHPPNRACPSRLDLQSIHRWTERCQIQLPAFRGTMRYEAGIVKPFLTFRVGSNDTHQIVAVGDPLIKSTNPASPEPGADDCPSRCHCIHGMRKKQSCDRVFIGTGQDTYLVNCSMLLTHALGRLVPHKSEVNKSHCVPEIV